MFEHLAGGCGFPRQFFEAEGAVQPLQQGPFPGAEDHIFMPLIGGALLDRYPGAAGYQLYFGFIAVLCTIGLLAVLVIGRSRRTAGRGSVN